MAGFRLKKSYTMPKADLREAAEGLAASLEERHGMCARWHGDSVEILGSGVDAKLSFHDGVVQVSVKLGLMAAAFQRPLKAEVQRYLDEHIF